MWSDLPKFLQSLVPSYFKKKKKKVDIVLENASQRMAIDTIMDGYIY